MPSAPSADSGYTVLPLPEYLSHVFRFQGDWYSVDLDDTQIPGAIIEVWNEKQARTWVKIPDNANEVTAKFAQALGWFKELRKRRHSYNLAAPRKTIVFKIITPNYRDMEVVYPHTAPVVAQIESALSHDRTIAIELLFCLLYRKHELRRYTLKDLKRIPGRNGGCGYQGVINEQGTTLSLYFDQAHNLSEIQQVTLD